MSLTAERVRELLEYESETGVLIWKKLTRNRRVKIGSEAGCVWTGRGLQYRVMRIDGTLYYAHRLIVMIETGNWPLHEVDHIDGNGLNNRWKNLRCVSRSVNGRNCRIWDHNTSGIIGVYWDKTRTKWRAQIQYEGKNIFLGRFANKDAAIAARKAGETQYGFHVNHGRASQ